MNDDAGDAVHPSSPSAHGGLRRRRRPWPRISTALVGLGLLIAGVITVLVADGRSITALPATTYSGSYEPLPEGTEMQVAYESDFWAVPDAGVVIGLLLAVAGAAVLLVALGWWISDLRRPPVAGPARMPRRRPWPQLVTAVAGVAAGVVGLVVRASTPPASFGWFAYAPTSNDYFFPTMIQPTEVVGSGLVVVGVAVLTFAFGWWVGGRRRPDPDVSSANESAG